MKKTVSSKFKRLGAFVLAMAFALVISVPAYAATSDANMTSDYSQWTLSVAPGSSVTLYASPADASYTATGFDSDATTTQVSWTSSNTSIATVSNVGFENAPSSLSSLSGIYCTKATVSVPSTATIGSCSIEVENVATNASVNYTILVDSTATATASNVNVYIADFGATLSAGTVSNTTRNFATPTDALKQLKADSSNSFSYSGSDSYITSMTYGGSTLTLGDRIDATTGEWYGWNYRVYRKSGDDSYLVADSEVIAADAFKLEPYDTVVWKYGTMNIAATYFTDALSDLI